MALPYKFNFRSTSALVSDPAGDTYCISASNVASAAAETYSTTRNSITFGWESPATFVGTRDRTSTAGKEKFAGMHTNESDVINTFRVDLPAGGTYSIRIAAGDFSNSQTCKVEIFDNTTSRGVLCNGSTGAADTFFDAVGAKYSSANWGASNTAVTANISSGIFKMKIGDGASVGTGHIAHLEIDAVATNVSSVVGSLLGQ